MLTKTSLLIALATVGLFSTAACTKSSNADSSPSVNTAGKPLKTAQEPTVAAAYTAGVAATTSDVVSLSMYHADGTAITNEESVSLFATYSTLSERSKELAAVNRAVMTTDSHVELYSSNDLVMVLEIKNADANAKLVWSRSAFAAESILFASQAVDQNEMSSALNFNFKACLTPEKQAPYQSQKQSQSQGKDKTPDPVLEPVCQVMQAVLVMKEVPTPKQDQSQDQSQDKGQDKGKN